MKKQLLFVLPLVVAGAMLYPRFVNAQDAPKPQNNAELQKRIMLAALSMLAVQADRAVFRDYAES